MNLQKQLKKIDSNYLKGRYVILMDMLLSLAATVISLILVRAFHGEAAMPAPTFWVYLILSFVTSAACFLTLHTYRIIIRHISVRDLLPFAYASLFKGLAIFLVIWLLEGYSDGLLLAVMVDTAFTIFALIGARMIMILVYVEMQRRVGEKYEHIRLLIYGTSDKSLAALLRLRHSTHYMVTGFVKRGEEREVKMLAGHPVMPFNDEETFGKVVRQYRADAILFATDGDAQAEDQGVVKYCSSHGIKTFIVPKVSEGLGDNALLRELRMEDILMRDEIVISMDEIRDSLSGSVVMVTGAAGSIGSELVRQLATFGVRRIVLFDNAETPMHNLRLELEDTFPSLSFVPIIGDVRQIARLDFAFRTERPEVVFHAAAYKHVPLREENPREAVLVNVLGTRNVADKCVE